MESVPAIGYLPGMVRLALLSVASIVLGGCVLTAVGVGVWADTTYKSGVGTQDFEAPIKETWEACLAQLDAMGAVYDKDFKFDFKKGSKMTVHTPDGEHSGWVEVEPHPEQTKYTRVRARGYGSNRDKKKQAYALLDGMDARLGGAGDLG